MPTIGLHVRPPTRQASRHTLQTIVRSSSRHRCERYNERKRCPNPHLSPQRSNNARRAPSIARQNSLAGHSPTPRPHDTPTTPSSSPPTGKALSPTYS